MSSIFQMGDPVMTLQMSVTPASHTGEGQDGPPAQGRRKGWAG